MRWITTEAFSTIKPPPAEISLAALKVVKDAINNGTDPVEAKKKAMAIYGDLGPFTAKQSALLEVVAEFRTIS